MDPKLREMLVCPLCKSALEYRAQPEELKCASCRRVYPVREGIPIMLPEEARQEP